MTGLLLKQEITEITAKNMVPIYMQPLPQITLTDFDTECDQVLFSVKQTLNIDDVIIKPSQKLSDKIYNLETRQNLFWFCPLSLSLKFEEDPISCC